MTMETSEAIREDENDAVEVEVSESNWLDDKGAKPTSVEKVGQAEQEQDDDLGEYSEGVKKRIATLTKKFREAERQRDAAAEYARNIQAERDQYRQRMEALDKGYLGEYETRVTSEVATVQTQLKRAMDEHDHDAVIKAQTRLSELAYEQQRLRSAKAYQQRALQQQAAVQQQYVPQAYQQAYQQPVQQPRVDPKAQKWAERNEWFGTDRVLTKTAMGIHEQLVEEEGIDATSDEYYTELDKRMKKYLGGSEATRKPSQAVAGVSRTSSTSSTSSRKVRLTRSQVDMAKRLGVPVEEYAKYVKS